MTKDKFEKKEKRQQFNKPQKQIIEFFMEQSDELKERIYKCIKENNIDIGKAAICGLMVSPYISKETAGRCIRSGKQLKHFSNYDYIIEISQEFWDNVSDKTKQILILHEVLHINIKYKKDGTQIYALNPHDIEDFSKLISKYGVDWIKDIQLVKEHIKDKESEQNG